MDYTVKSINEDTNTATVLMNVNGTELVQDFDLGANVDELKTNIERGMAVVAHEVANNAPAVAPSGYAALVNVQEVVKTLPTIDPADFAAPVAQADLVTIDPAVTPAVQ